MHKALNYLGLARKGGMAELGEEPVCAAARAGHAVLVIVAADAGDHTWRRAKSDVAGTQQQCLRVPFTKDELGQAIGRTDLALAALTDPALALAFVRALDRPDADVTAALESRVSRVRQHRREEQAHRRNVRTGKVRHPAQKKQG